MLPVDAQDHISQLSPLACPFKVDPSLAYYFLLPANGPLLGRKFWRQLLGTRPPIKPIPSVHRSVFYLKHLLGAQKVPGERERGAWQGGWLNHKQERLAGGVFLMRTQCYTVSMWHSCGTETFTRTRTHVGPSTRQTRWVLFKGPLAPEIKYIIQNRGDIHSQEFSASTQQQ